MFAQLQKTNELTPLLLYSGSWQMPVLWSLLCVLLICSVKLTLSPNPSENKKKAVNFSLTPARLISTIKGYQIP